MPNTSLTLRKLIELLNDKQFHDGTTLGCRLNISRAAVCKIIKKLRLYGITIFSVKNKGYQLQETLILLDTQQILSQLSEIRVKKMNLEIWETLNSTNDYLKNLLQLSSSSICKKKTGLKYLRKAVVNNTHSQLKYQICLSEHQSHGKARHNERQWHSPFAQNIYFSCLVAFDKDVSELGGLSLVTGLAVVKALNTFNLPDKLWLKWPNDILCRQKKIGGILIDIKAEAHGRCHAIIGIGINVNMRFSHTNNTQISQAWTSLAEITGNYIDRNQVCALLITELVKAIEVFQQKGLAAFMSAWKEADYLLEKDIVLKHANQATTQGTVKGINLQGHLLLSKNGALQAFSSGDISIVHS